MNNRVCLKCHEQLRGRADQKFCSDQCRSSYNNLQFVQSNIVIRAINRILKKNYFILSSYLEEGKNVALKNDLLQRGYRFDYFTCTCNTARNHKTNYFVYDHGYRDYENNKVLILRRVLNKEMSDPK